MFEWLFAQSEDESVLIEKAKTNHRDFARLYDKYVNVVYRFVKRHVSTEDDVHDIVSETFMAVAIKIKQYDTSREQKFTTRLLAIAKYKLADHRRAIYKQKEISMDEDFDPAYEQDMVVLLQNKTLYEQILSFAATLPPQQGNMFTLRYIEELTNKEIAELCDLDEKNVSCTLSIVLKKLKKRCISESTS